MSTVAHGDRVVVTHDSAPSGAPYSPAVIHGDLVWTSGALPVEPDGSVSEDFTAQVRAALANLEKSLVAAGADWSTVIKVNGYVADIERLPELNEVYTEVVCRDGAPTRTTVEVPRFRGRTLVEFDAVAHRRPESDR